MPRFRIFNHLFDRSVCPEDLLLLCKADLLGSCLTEEQYAGLEETLCSRLRTFRETTAQPGVTGPELIAAGFSSAEKKSAETFGLSLNEKGRLGCSGYHTDDPKIFAAGDMRLGATLVVTAISEGRAAAKAIDEYLEGYTNL